MLPRLNNFLCSTDAHFRQQQCQNWCCILTTSYLPLSFPCSLLEQPLWVVFRLSINSSSAQALFLRLAKEEAYRCSLVNPDLALTEPHPNMGRSRPHWALWEPRLHCNPASDQHWDLDSHFLHGLGYSNDTLTASVSSQIKPRRRVFMQIKSTLFKKLSIRGMVMLTSLYLRIFLPSS